VGGYIFGGLPFVRDHFSVVVLAIIALSLTPTLWEMYRVRMIRRRAADTVEPVDVQVR
jgi:membrane-associated protein